MIDARIELISTKKLVGMHIETTAAKSKAAIIWQKFMPRHREVQGNYEGIFLSVQDFPSQWSFSTFDPNASFTTWAAKEVHPDAIIPEDFSTTQLLGGLYAVCTHHGIAASIGFTLSYMYGKWIPESGHQIDLHRKHFEVLGKDYLGPNNPDTKEQVWIPVIPIPTS